MNALTSFGLAAFMAASAAFAAQAAETEYSGMFCGHAKTTMLQASDDATVFQVESWNIQTPDSGFKPWENASNHCIAYYRIMQGKATAIGSCLWTDSGGDTFIGELSVAPDIANGWTFLAGASKWKGITGGGTWQMVATGKNGADGSGTSCISHNGKYTLP
jgi:hypothetical protein